MVASAKARAKGNVAAFDDQGSMRVLAPRMKARLAVRVGLGTSSAHWRALPCMQHGIEKACQSVCAAGVPTIEMPLAGGEGGASSAQQTATLPLLR